MIDRSPPADNANPLSDPDAAGNAPLPPPLPPLPPPPPPALKPAPVVRPAPAARPAAAARPAPIAAQATPPAKPVPPVAKPVPLAAPPPGGRPVDAPPRQSLGDEPKSAVGPGTDDEFAEIEPPRRFSFADFAPPWLVSLVVHLVALLLLALIVSPAGEGISRVLLTIGQSERESLGEFTEFSIVEEPDMFDDDAMTLDSVVPVDLFEDADSPLESPTEALVTVDSELGKLIVPEAPMFGGRSGAMRQTLLEIYGGTEETEAAVDLGLRWLSRQQNRDGSWSLKGPYQDGAVAENRVAATAMALLAFLGAGQTHQEGEFKDKVHKGIRWLVAQQDRDGFFANEGQDHQRTYAQAQSSIVVCELFGMTADSWLRAPAQLALDYAQSAQAEQGGWRYRPREPGDTSVTGWYVMALQSGMSAGLSVDQATLYKTRQFLDSVQHDDGAAYSYQAFGGPTSPMTAEGLLCRQYLGWDRDEPALIRGIDYFTKRAPFDRSQPNLYYWYYATQVLHHFGGNRWTTWNEVMREELPAMQVKRGRELGSWAPQRDEWGSRSGGRLFTTCFAIYCLEVYYRHMPLYRGAE